MAIYATRGERFFLTNVKTSVAFTHESNKSLFGNGVETSCEAS